MGCFSGRLLSAASDQKLFCKLSSPFCCSFDEFVEEKVISPSYSSAILTPPSDTSSFVLFCFSPQKSLCVFVVFLWFYTNFGFPCGSAGKESACNEGDPSLIPGLGRYPGEGKSYPLQYSGLENSMARWTGLSDFHFLSSLVAQAVKCLSTVQDTRVQSLGR